MRKYWKIALTVALLLLIVSVIILMNQASPNFRRVKSLSGNFYKVNFFGPYMSSSGGATKTYCRLAYFTDAQITDEKTINEEARDLTASVEDPPGCGVLQTLVVSAVKITNKGIPYLYNESVQYNTVFSRASDSSWHPYK